MNNAGQLRRDSYSLSGLIRRAHAVIAGSTCGVSALHYAKTNPHLRSQLFDNVIMQLKQRIWISSTSGAIKSDPPLFNRDRCVRILF